MGHGFSIAASCLFSLLGTVMRIVWFDFNVKFVGIVMIVPFFYGFGVGYLVLYWAYLG